MSIHPVPLWQFRQRSTTKQNKYTQESLSYQAIATEFMFVTGREQIESCESRQLELEL